MTITKLTRTDLAPDLEAYQALFAQAELSHPAPSLSGDLQPRLFYGLEQLLYTPAVSSFMLVKALKSRNICNGWRLKPGLCTSLPHRFTASAMR
ncbi:hypothetical protein A7K92_20795 [Klebsiella pneumoniae]|nr:hypothetical protein A7K92_20795 [Klebsiella pneumoniae]